MATEVRARRSRPWRRWAARLGALAGLVLLVGGAVVVRSFMPAPWQTQAVPALHPEGTFPGTCRDFTWFPDGSIHACVARPGNRVFASVELREGRVKSKPLFGRAASIVTMPDGERPTPLAFRLPDGSYVQNWQGHRGRLNLRDLRGGSPSYQADPQAWRWDAAKRRYLAYPLLGESGLMEFDPATRDVFFTPGQLPHGVFAPAGVGPDGNLWYALPGETPGSVVLKVMDTRTRKTVTRAEWQLPGQLSVQAAVLSPRGDEIACLGCTSPQPLRVGVLRWLESVAARLFPSRRGGWSAVWVCKIDGTHPRLLARSRLTAPGTSVMEEIRWSPDGTKVAISMLRVRPFRMAIYSASVPH